MSFHMTRYNDVLMLCQDDCALVNMASDGSYTGLIHSSGTAYVWLLRASIASSIGKRFCYVIQCVFVRYVIRQMLKYIKVRRPSYVRLEQR